MPYPRKHFEHNGLYFITSRTEEGLPFLDTARFKPIFLSILARAQTLYPCRLSAYCLMANHFHLLLLPIDPDNVPFFIKYIKQELSHAVNKLRGRRKKTIWCGGYDSPRIISYHKAIKYFSYVHLQPVAAGICSYEENYTGATSASVRRLYIAESKYHRRYRPKIEEENKEITHQLIVEPLAWADELAPESSREKVLQDIDGFMSYKRAELRQSKVKRGRGFYVSPIEEDEDCNIEKIRWADGYVPTKRGIKTRVIGDNNVKRIEYLCYLLRQEARCKFLYQQWKLEPCTPEKWPTGFFMPALPRRSRALPVSLDY